MNQTAGKLDCTGLARRVEAVYREIATTRMAGLPLLNPAIGIHAIGFRAWEDGCLGVLVTPWCMNLLSLPGLGDDWFDKPELSEETVVFPSGTYRFTIGHEPALGKYRMCSLFSPMFEFADDAAAVETAEAVMRELLNEENRELPEIDTAAITALWQEDRRADPEDDGKLQSGTSAPSLQEKLERPVSRRALLRGTLMREDSTA